MAPKRSIASSRPNPPAAEAFAGARGIVSPLEIRVSSDYFDGSLIALLRLVADRKIDLLDVPLLPVCIAYFDYMAENQVAQPDEAWATLSALSYLLERKARRLLPVPEEETAEQEDALALLSISDGLANLLDELRPALAALRLGQEARSRLFFRTAEEETNYDLPVKLAELTMADLAFALQQALVRSRPADPTVPPARRSLRDVIRGLLAKLTRSWSRFWDLLEPQHSREDAVYLFLGILELMRAGKIRIKRVEGEVEFSLT